MRHYIRRAVVLAVFATALLMSIPATAGSLTEAQLNAEPLDTGLTVTFDRIEIVPSASDQDTSLIGVVYLYVDSSTTTKVYYYKITDSTRVSIYYSSISENIAEAEFVSDEGRIYSTITMTDRVHFVWLSVWLNRSAGKLFEKAPYVTSIGY